MIENVNFFSDGHLAYGHVAWGDDGRISEILALDNTPHADAPLLLPGAIDAHVHFREPGMTQKGDIASESLAAAAGGVTFVLDMPNVKPATTSPEALTEKHRLYQEKCRVNYGLWYGITSNNIEEALHEFGRPDSPRRDEVCGFKVFLGSSTGGMLMNDKARLRTLFSGTQRVIGLHSESEDIIRRNAEKYRAIYGENEIPIECHPRIRDVEACMETTRMAVGLARETGAQVHLCHVTTAEELQFFPDSNITAEVCVAHLWFSQEDYKRLGARIKCNPAIKRIQDRDELRRALTDGRIFSVGTDHAPHLLSDKQGGSLRAASGMPSVQYSLLAMLELVHQGVLPLNRMVALMSENPARRFGLEGRGAIRVGNFADLVLVDPKQTTSVDQSSILSKCGWSPFEGTTFSHKVLRTWCNGRLVYNG